MKKQFLAKLLVLAMVLAMVPVTILAASAEEGDQDVTAGTTEQQANSDYSYSVAADTEITEIPADGVIVALPVGGVSNAVVKADIVDALPIEADSVILKLDTTGAEKVSVTVPADALADKVADNGEGLIVECTQARITIPGDQLAKAIKDAGTLAIVVDVAEDDVAVTVYVDWVVTKIPGTVIEAL